MNIPRQKEQEMQMSQCRNKLCIFKLKKEVYYGRWVLTMEGVVRDALGEKGKGCLL